MKITPDDPMDTTALYLYVEIGPSRYGWPNFDVYESHFFALKVPDAYIRPTRILGSYGLPTIDPLGSSTGIYDGEPYYKYLSSLDGSTWYLFYTASTGKWAISTTLGITAAPYFERQDGKQADLRGVYGPYAYDPFNGAPYYMFAPLRVWEALDCYALPNEVNGFDVPYIGVSVSAAGLGVGPGAPGISVLCEYGSEYYGTPTVNVKFTR